MPVTPIYGIPYPDGSSAYTPLQDWFAGIATAVENVIQTGLGGAPRIANSDSERNTIYPTPLQGNTVVRPDLGYTEGYYGLFNSGTNPGGAATAGWYPIAGKMPTLTRSRLAASLQSIAANTNTAVLLTNQVTNDTPGITYNATTGEFTVTRPGFYLVTAVLNYQGAAASNQRQLAIVVLNGTTYAESGGGSIAAVPVSQNISVIVPVTTANSVIRLNALTVQAQSTFGQCTVAFMGAV